MTVRAILSVCLLICVSTATLHAGEKIRPEIKTERVLFLGNSITRHGILKKIGWEIECGMAASSPEKDYVHLVIAGIADATGGKPEFKAQNIADFERNYATQDIEATLKDAVAFKPTLVIVAIGENVPGLGTDDAKAKYKESYTKLLALLKNNGQPTVLVRSGFWPDAGKDTIMLEAGKTAGAICVDISALGKDESNYARSERKFEHAGVAAHPGDKGMRAIADAMLGAIKK